MAGFSPLLTSVKFRPLRDTFPNIYFSVSDNSPAFVNYSRPSPEKKSFYLYMHSIGLLATCFSIFIFTIDPFHHLPPALLRASVLNVIGAIP